MDLASAAQTVVRFYRHLDDRDYAALVGMMAPDGVWYRQGATLQGGDAIIAALSRRSPTVRIHHLLTNVFAVLDDDGRAQVTAYMIVVRHDSGGHLDGPAPFTGFESIRTIRATLAAAPTGWLVSQMRGDPPSFTAAP